METETTEPGKYLSLKLDETLLADIDEFRFEQRFESRTKAIQWLLRTALDKKLAPKFRSALKKLIPRKDATKKVASTTKKKEQNNA
jgi:hypothetical protein